MKPTSADLPLLLSSLGVNLQDASNYTADALSKKLRRALDYAQRASLLFDSKSNKPKSKSNNKSNDNDKNRNEDEDKDKAAGAKPEAEAEAEEG